MIGKTDAGIIRRICVELTEQRGAFNIMQVMDGLTQCRRRRCPTTGQIRFYLQKQEWISHEGRRYCAGFRVAVYSVKNTREAPTFDVLAEVKQETEIMA